MHIEPGIVNDAKMVLAYATAAGAAGVTAKLAWDDLTHHSPVSFFARCVASAAMVFIFFEVLPHYPVGVSEVHFILGTTIFLIFGMAPAAIGLAGGLLIQGVFFAPSDIPMYVVNITTLLVPLFAIGLLAKRIIAPGTPYVDLKYWQALALSTTYQGGVIAWVAFWALYGQGFGAENIAAVTAFGAAYLVVILIEPIADLAVLAGAKAGRDLLERTGLSHVRLHSPA